MELRYFTAVAIHGSFTRTAEVLHLTQPALCQAKNLEGDKLLVVRGTNSITLTPTEEAFYEDARDVIACADRLSSALAASAVPNSCVRLEPACIAAHNKFEIRTSAPRRNLGVVRIE